MVTEESDSDGLEFIQDLLSSPLASLPIKARFLAAFLVSCYVDLPSITD
jgi:hypothetical protein